MTRKTTHVTPNGNDGWKVIQGGAERATKVFDTKQDAIDYGRDLSRNVNSEFIIHGKDGQIQRADSHGGDPCPPRDKK